MTLKAGKYRERREAVPPFAVRVASYRIGRRYHCTVDNVDPGAVIAREEGATRAQAEEAALAKARERLARSRLVRP